MHVLTTYSFSPKNYFYSKFSSISTHSVCCVRFTSCMISYTENVNIRVLLQQWVVHKVITTNPNCTVISLSLLHIGYDAMFFLYRKNSALGAQQLLVHYQSPIKNGNYQETTLHNSITFNFDSCRCCIKHWCSIWFSSCNLHLMLESDGKPKSMRVFTMFILYWMQDSGRF